MKTLIKEKKLDWVNKLKCIFFGHNFPEGLTDARCDELPTGVEIYGEFSVRCEHECIRCGLTKEFRDKCGY